MALPAGAPGVAVLETRQLNRTEIIAVGIDPDDPRNQGVHSFDIELNGIRRQVYGSTGGVLYGAGCSNGACSWGGGGGGSEGRTTARATVVGGETVIHWLTIPGGSRYLKEFFAVSLTVTSLSPAPFRFTRGAARLDLPSGLSLADTSTAQQLVVPMGDIGAGSSATADWIVRGDVEGDYTLSAEYTGVLDPTGTPITLEAQAQSALRVYGGDAAQVVVEADAVGVAHRPYRFRVGMRNVSDSPAYNVTFTLQDGDNFIFQPEQRRSYVWSQIPAGQTV